MLGTGSAVSNDRAQTSVLVDGSVLVDCGAGTVLRLSQTGVPAHSIQDIVLTHDHVDHVSDVMPLLKKATMEVDEHPGVTVHGPREALDTVRSLFDAFSYIKPKLDVEYDEVDDGSKLEAGDLEFTAVETEHGTPSVAYRVEELVISGDTEPVEEVAELADGAEALVHECAYPDGAGVDGHTTPSELVEDVLSRCTVDRVYLTHLFPEAEGRKPEMLEKVRDGFDGEVYVADDLTRFSVG